MHCILLQLTKRGRSWLLHLLLDDLRVHNLLFADRFNHWPVLVFIRARDVVHAAHLGLVVAGVGFASELADQLLMLFQVHYFHLSFCAVGRLGHNLLPFQISTSEGLFERAFYLVFDYTFASRN